MPQIYQTVMRQQLSKIVGEKYIDKAYLIAKNEVDKEKQEVIDFFEDSEITKEIEAGEDAQNTSNTLEGIEDGNLFSFVGFDQGSDPVGVVREALEDEIYLGKQTSRGAKYLQDRIVYEFPVYAPSPKFSLRRIAPMPWGKGSWLQAIEDGISNLNYYLFERGKSLKNSRSGPAVQLDNKVGGVNFASLNRKAKYSPPKDGYLFTKLKEFVQKFS